MCIPNKCVIAHAEGDAGRYEESRGEDSWDSRNQLSSTVYNKEKENKMC
jgi:hypothetical protein